MKLFYERKRDKKIGQKSGTCANVVNIINISSSGFYLMNLNICPRILFNYSFYNITRRISFTYNI